LVWLDRIVMAGILSLLVFSPLAIGSVNPWAYCTVEATIFFLVVVWMARLAIEGELRSFSGLRTVLIPAALFIGLIFFQLLPLPPAIQGVLSPSTYRLYETTLPGWPGRNSGGEREVGPGGQLNPGSGKLTQAVPGRDGSGAGKAKLATIENEGDRWRPLSIAPALTREAVLKVIAYGCLFFLILLYPMRSYPRPLGERRFCRRLLTTVVVIGMAIAVIGLLEQAFWNGAILWLYIPYDWGRPMPDFNTRAAGPFVNPDHFAAYLNMILPLALSGCLLQTFLTKRWSRHEWFGVLCFAAASVLICAIALSLSRGGLIAGVIGAAIVIWVALRKRWRGYGPFAGLRSKVLGCLYVLVLVTVVASAALYTAPAAPTAVNARLEATLSEPDLGSRLRYWRGTIAMIRDFPLLGVGLGCFEDLFPRYQRPPWFPLSVREAHNDYLELTADAGLAGLALALWFFLAAGVRMFRGLRTAPAEVAPVVAALAAGIAAIAFQEFFDFPLQLPANAILFTILFALALRLSGAGRDERTENHYTDPTVRSFAAIAAVAATVLIFLTLRQDQVPYPYLRALPRNARAARALILQHPARSTAHLWYAMLERNSPATQMKELAVAAWLEPNNPLILDRYAQVLAANGDTDSALAALKRSVFAYPSMEDHFYLQAELIAWLSREERQAIAAGFRTAMAHRFEGASQSYAAFCAALNHHAAEADALAKASASSDQPARRLQLLIQAGAAYAQSDELARAQAAFEQAARIVPSDPAPYEYLATRIFAPRKDLNAAKAAVETGLRNGADPFALYISLARADEQAGDMDGAEHALLRALWLRPEGRYDFDTLMRLADLERRADHLAKAELWMRRAIEVQPASPQALYQLALVEEHDYEYGQALLDLSKAIKLEPGNTEMRHHYQDLLHMIAVQSKHNSQ
jgi:O-antigen ligase